MTSKDSGTIRSQGSLTCECLFCDKGAIARFTAPLLKPRFLICDEHLQSQLAWATQRYRSAPGQVIVENIEGRPS